MDHRTSRRRSGSIARTLGFCASVALASCATTQPQAPIAAKAPETIALEQIPDDLVQACAGPKLEEPPNTVGDLLDDVIYAYILYAECAARNSALVNYLRPIVERAKGLTPAK